MSKSAEIFRKNLRLAMKSSGLSQGRLSELSGVAQPHISKYLKENTHHEPRIDTVERLAEAAGLSVKDVLSSKDPKIDGSLTSIQREIILLIRRMNDAELDPFLKMLRAWPGNASFKAREQKKQA